MDDEMSERSIPKPYGKSYRQFLRVLVNSEMPRVWKAEMLEAFTLSHIRRPEETEAMVDKGIMLLIRRVPLEDTERFVSLDSGLKPLSWPDSEKFARTFVTCLNIVIESEDKGNGLQRLDRIVAETDLSGYQISWLLMAGEKFYNYYMDNLLAAVDFGVLQLDYKRFNTQFLLGASSGNGRVLRELELR